MRKYLNASTLLTSVMFPGLLLAQNGTGTDQALPDLSGIWEVPYVQTRRDICGETACRALLGAQPPPPSIIMEQPQMLPWAEEKYKAVREGVQDPNAPGREEADPWFSACMPMGPSRLMLNTFVALELRQFPDVVLLLFGSPDIGNTVRRIYLDGRGHPASWKPMSMGHSIGRYEGDTLVVDTIGINDKSWIDEQGHPHSDALHLLERIRRVDQKSLEYEVTIEDPKAYKNSWRKKIVRELASPTTPRFWDNVLCEELLQMGTHYSAEAKK